MPTLVSVIPPILIFLCLYAGFLKLAAHLLRYTLGWGRSLVFAAAMLMIAIGLRALQFAIGYWLPLLAAIPLAFAIYVLLSVLLLGGHAATSSGALLGWRESFQLAVFAFLLMAGFAVILLGVSRHSSYSSSDTAAALTMPWSEWPTAACSNFEMISTLLLRATRDPSAVAHLVIVRRSDAHCHRTYAQEIQVQEEHDAQTNGQRPHCRRRPRSREGVFHRTGSKA